MIRLALAVFLALANVSQASAHKASDSYLALTLRPGSVEGQWDIALRDLEQAIGLDADGDRAITWGELEAAQDAVFAYALPRLTLTAGGTACVPVPSSLLADRHTDGGYAVLRFQADCAGATHGLDLTYRLLFDIDTLHRGLLRVMEGDRVHTAVLGPDAPTFHLEPAQAPDLRRQVLSYGWQGVWHIWIGLDHILFLLALLLPAVLRRHDGGWQAVGSFREAGIDVLKVVSAFTLAHSTTLTLAALELVELPSRAVEATIAASVVLAALNNIRPVVERSLWVVAFGFGLIHGLGFAGALAELGLPAHALLPSLLAFNAGVELGQLAIVALFLPLAFLVRSTGAYSRIVLRGGSAAVAAVAGLWLVERAFDLVLL